MYKKLLNVGIVSIFVFAAFGVHAQVSTDPVQYIVSPEVPGPNQTVTIEAQGVGTFLGDATITWSKDGKVVQTGIGSRSYSFVTGPIGSATKVRADIKPGSAGSFVRDFLFRPSSINLVWEADTSVPPLFAGHALYSAGSRLRVVAFPTVVINGAQVSPASLSYQWTRNDLALPQQSGQGRSALSIQGDQLQPEENIAVDVYFGSVLVARGAIAVPASQPQLVLYERDALRGVLYDAGVPQAINLSAKEMTFKAEPYYFATQALQNGALSYQWTIDGNDISGPDSGRGILTLRQTGSGAGQAILSATLQNSAADQLVQTAQAMVSILFGQGSGSSIFGI